MAYLPDSTKKIALTGASIVIDAKDYLPETAREIVLAAKSVGGHATVLNACSYLPETAEAIARAGGKNVTVYLTL
jgi:hypothetical protein